MTCPECEEMPGERERHDFGRKLYGPHVGHPGVLGHRDPSGPPSELSPTFDVSVTVNLDGDDDPDASTANAVTLLKGALAQMVDWGAIRAFTVEVRP